MRQYNGIARGARPSNPDSLRALSLEIARMSCDYESRASVHERSHCDQRHGEPREYSTTYVVCNLLCSAAVWSTSHQQVDKHIRCRQETIQYALRPPNQIVFELLVPTLNRAEARGLQ
jgi:hypothetical protein